MKKYTLLNLTLQIIIAIITSSCFIEEIFNSNDSTVVQPEAKGEKIFIEKENEILAESLFRLGVSFYNAKNYKEAKKTFIKALKFNYGHKGAKDFLKKTLEKLGEPVGRYKDNIAKEKLNIVKGLYEEGKALYEKEKYEKCIKNFQEVLEFIKGIEYSENLEDYHQGAYLYIRNAYNKLYPLAAEN